MIGLVVLCQNMFNPMAESCKRKHLRLLDTLGVMTPNVLLDGSLTEKNILKCSSATCLYRICRFLSDLGPAEKILCPDVTAMKLPKMGMKTIL